MPEAGPPPLLEDAPTVAIVVTLLGMLAVFCALVMP